MKVITIFSILIFSFLGVINAESKGFKIYSESFKAEGSIPVKYSCQGEDMSPHLKWDNVPGNTKSFALICDDPDAPMGTWVHWVAYNIPQKINSLNEDFPVEEKMGNGITQGYNDFGNIGYGGPCPPSGKAHRYFFKLYALDAKLNLPAGLTKKQLLEKIRSHIIEKTSVYGIYKRR